MTTGMDAVTGTGGEMLCARRKRKEREGWLRGRDGDTRREERGGKSLEILKRDGEHGRLAFSEAHTLRTGGARH
jgi:hypothetical protein